MNEEVEVTQADREAAAELYVNDPEAQDWLLSGNSDETAIVQYFAHRRLKAEERERRS